MQRTTTDKIITAAVKLSIAAFLFLWVLLYCLTAFGVIRPSLFSAMLISGSPVLLVALTLTIIDLLAKLKRWRRRRKTDRRIIRQAKAVGVWNKEPIVLGGRALELKARKYFKIKRAPGETDIELRRRCMNKVDNKYAESIAKVYDIESKRKRRIK